ncbi:MAG: hypothetical protein ACJ79K_14510 [Gemmatimonadaceae bacterium]
MSFATSVGSDNPFGFALLLILLVLLMAAWVIFAASRFMQGGIVERPERVPQLYGYTACLVGLLWALSSAVSLVNHLLERSDPALAATSSFPAYDEPSVTSFEAFRATYDRARRFGSPDAATALPADSIPEAELKRRYEALRPDHIHQAEYRTRNAIVESLLGLILGAGLFVFHWRWLRRRGLDLEAVRLTATGPRPVGGA